MKIEIAESLGYSYLRHVKNCWLVQTNWKASEHWEKQFTDEELDRAFSSMRDTFDPNGNVFKDTRNSQQFLKQAEIDVIGIEQDGTIHALDVAYHGAGLNYGGGVINRVLKKMLRTLFVLETYHPADVERQIYFLSPKVNPGVQKPLEEMLVSLRTHYTNIHWHLLTNEVFTSDVLQATLDSAGSVADTAELFVRSAKLLELGDSYRNNASLEIDKNKISKSVPTKEGVIPSIASNSRERVQPIVQRIMKTLLEDYPTLIDDDQLSGFLDSDYCKQNLGLRIGNFPLIRRKEEGRELGGYDRYWEEIYGARYYVCSQWGKRYHLHNAKSMLHLVSALIEEKKGHPGEPSLVSHKSDLLAYIG